MCDWMETMYELHTEEVKEEVENYEAWIQETLF